MYGDHRDLHVLTHPAPTRRSSDLPMSYYAPDSPDVAQDVLLTLILNSETGDVLNETYYAYNADLGTYGELTADPSGIIVPNVLTIDAEGNQTWTPTTD